MRIVQTKKCPKCNEVKSLDEFYQDRSTSKGLSSWCKQCMIARVLQWQKDNSAKKRETNKASYAKLRLLVLDHYSNGLMSCACCGESTIEFLTLDHVNNDGAKHRKEIGKNSIWRWLTQHNLPEGFQVLCWNCNSAKGYYGECPHQKLKGKSNETRNCR